MNPFWAPEAPRGDGVRGRSVFLFFGHFAKSEIRKVRLGLPVGRILCPGGSPPATYNPRLDYEAVPTPLDGSPVSPKSGDTRRRDPGSRGVHPGVTGL